MYQLRYREELPPAVVKELDDLVATYNNLLSRVLNEDGTINWPAALGIPQPKPDEIYNPPSSPILQQFLQATQAEGQRWKTGPWTFEDTLGKRDNAAVRQIVVDRDVDDLTAGGLSGCVAFELNATVDAEVTGIDVSPLSDIRRVLVVGNITATNKTITLKHEDSGSAPQNRFHFDGGVDIELTVGQYVWLFYSVGLGRWTMFVTGHASGGIVSYDQLQTAISGISVTGANMYVSEVDLGTMETIATPVELAPAPGVGKVIVPIAVDFIQASATDQFIQNAPITLTVKYSGITTGLFNTISVSNSLNRYLYTREFALPTNFGAGTGTAPASTVDPHNQSVVVKGNNNVDYSGGGGVSKGKFRIALAYSIVTIANPVAT